MPAPWELAQQIPPLPLAKAIKRQSGDKFFMQVPWGARGEWLWQKLMAA